MARRPTPDSQPAKLSRDELEAGVRRLEKRLEEVRQFDPKAIDAANPSESTRSLNAAIETSLGDVFGYNSYEFKRFRDALFFHYPVSALVRDPTAHIIEAVTRERTKSIQLLEAAVAQLRERYEQQQADAVATAREGRIDTGHSRKVFIVHGHDDGMKEGVARFLSAIGFDPIILHEQANKGRTIIQKFREEAKDVGFAVVLLSPDDETTAGQHRARQNVILELGFFLGALGPDRVAALKKGDVETPSDFDGVIYTAYEGNWKAAIATELQAVGYDIDWNKVMKP